MNFHLRSFVLTFATVLSLSACGSELPADEAGIGATCNEELECVEDNQTCLEGYAGGYCAPPCTTDEDCLEGSACARVDVNYFCFHTCQAKEECNLWREEGDESNCSATVDWVDNDTHRNDKACIPPTA